MIIEIITVKNQRYFNAELHQNIGSFDAEFLLDFFAPEMDDLSDAIYPLEKPLISQHGNSC